MMRIVMLRAQWHALTGGRLRDDLLLCANLFTWSWLLAILIAGWLS